MEPPPLVVQSSVHLAAYLHEALGLADGEDEKGMGLLQMEVGTAVETREVLQVQLHLLLPRTR
jgi:hypothetical protein